MAAHVIRKFYPGTAVLVLSGMIDPAARSTAKQIGVAGFLRKDHNVDHVVGADVIAGRRRGIRFLAIASSDSPRSA